MENFSTLNRDKSFQKKTFKYLFSVSVLIVLVYGAIFIAENYFASNVPSGNPGSSFATVKNGTNAWSQLLEESGHNVSRDKGNVTLPKLENVDEYSDSSDILDLVRSTSTIVVIGASLPQEEIDQIDEFVKDGGRLITDNPDILFSIFNDQIEISSVGSRNQTVNNSDINGTDGIQETEGSGVGSVAFSKRLNGQALLIPESDIQPNEISSLENFYSAAIIQHKKGDVIALEDTGVVSNEGLLRKDNALLSIRIAGEEGGKITFAEGVHGFSNATGINAMPLSWRVAMIGLIAAFIVFACAKSRRFGVGEDAARSLGPKRIQYASAIAHAMKKSKVNKS